MRRGTTTNYGTITTQTGIGAGTTSQPFSTAINGLSNGIFYHFRAANAGGTSYGADVIFNSSGTQ